VIEEKITIRDMAEADLPEIMKIELDSFPVPWSEGIFLGQLQRPEITDNRVIIVDGEMCGYIASWFGQGELHILSIAVSPERRRRGYAALLLERSLARGREKGCVKVVLEVRESNVPARGFYEKNGFRIIGRRKGYYRETGEDALILEREIEAG
jgi:ribosomal-protein-alanine N-acetyltransferase